MSASSSGPPSQLFFLRHGARLDQLDPEWHLSSPTPYDPPLTAKGILQARQTGLRINTLLPRTRRIILHTSPFLRCIQTALTLAAALEERVLLRVDAWLGEWMTPEYYTHIDPPPPARQLCAAAVSALGGQDLGSVQVDWMWDSLLLGPGGDYGEEWSAMHARITRGLEALIRHYETSPNGQVETVVILVTHGAGGNALLGAISQKPVLQDVSTASLSLARLRPATPSDSASYSYDLVLQADISHLDPPKSPPLQPIPVHNRTSSFNAHNRTSSFTAGTRPQLDKRVIEYHPVRSRSATQFPPLPPPTTPPKQPTTPVPQRHPSLKLQTGTASPKAPGLWTPSSASTTVSEDEDDTVDIGRRKRIVGLWRSWAAGENLDSGRRERSVTEDEGPLRERRV